MKGEFEQRLRQVIDEVQASRTADHPVHRRGAHPDRRRRRGRHRRCGQPAQAGAGARHPAHRRRHHLGRIQEAYRKGPGPDPPFPGRPGRRTERGEGDPDDARHRFDHGAAPQVQVLDEALEAAVKLSHRYIPARQLPDKSVSLLDTACARVAISQHAVPPEVDDCRKRIERAGNRARDHRPRDRGRCGHRRTRGRWRPRSSPNEKALSAELETRWEQRAPVGRRDPGTARQAACGGSTVEGEGGPRRPIRQAEAAGKAEAAEGAAGERRLDRAGARGTARRAQAIADGPACSMQGESAADPAHRRSSRPSPRWSRTGPAFRSGAWSRTRSEPS